MVRDLLAYATTREDLYFTPSLDVTVYIEELDHWQPLRNSNLSTLVSSLDNGTRDPAHVKIDDDAMDYLTLMQAGSFSPELHADPRMTRERVLALHRAGYSQPHDLLQSSDYLDIARETRIDEEVIKTIATKYAGGFATASDLAAGPFSEFSPSDDFEGWTVSRASDHLIRWKTRGRYSLTLSAGDHGVSLVATPPQDNLNPWPHKKHNLLLDMEDISPDAAIDPAYDWLDEHQLFLTDDLTRLTHVGPAKQEYLYFAHGVASFDGLMVMAEQESDVFTDVFGSYSEEIKQSLADQIDS